MKKKILLTEDTIEILLNLQEYLIMEGYEVSIARNGEEALKQLHLVVPDIIITDLLMDVMTGFELISELKKNPLWSKIPILVFSAKPINEDLDPAEIGADRFILKPSPPEVILEMIRELIH